MDTPAPLALLLQALEAGDLQAARTAAAELQQFRAGTTLLAAEVLHELRQPLLGVKAYTQMLTEEIGSRGALRQMLAQVERMEQIISDFTRLASERPAPRQLVSLVAPVQAAARAFALNPDSARIRLQVDVLEERAEELTVEGNGRLLEQLALNLFNNARDAVTGPGQVRAVLTREGRAPVLYVADWGRGIPDAVRPRLFEPYVTGSKRGTGLGLAVCRRIAQEHQARIELVSPSLLPLTPTPSTVFRVLFPPPEAVAPPPPEPLPLSPAPAAARPRLLVVDDEEIIRSVFKDLMSRECEVLEAATTEEALTLLERGRVDLIITDKNLPGMSGLELARRARQLDPHSRIILMTGYPSLVTAQQALELGLLDYLLKPFDDIREVRTRLREALREVTPPPRGLRPGSRRVDVLEDNPASARRLTEALTLLGLEARVLSTAPTDVPSAQSTEPPAAVVVSWDFGTAYGRQALALARQLGQGAPFVVLAEYPTQETVLESLRAGASGCLPRELETSELSRELSRLLQSA
ncbi:MAG: hybrid histidine protein kinase/response regulator SinK [Cystobacter sp.]